MDSRISPMTAMSTRARSEVRAGGRSVSRDPVVGCVRRCRRFAI
jgi:hypothetical protein